MQEVLPIGLAVFERSRQGGVSKVAEVFSVGSQDPIADLREEGQPAAKSMREQLDHLSPGLGNPVMPVTVAVEEPQKPSDSYSDLLIVLQQIEKRLDALRNQLPVE